MVQYMGIFIQKLWITCTVISKQIAYALNRFEFHVTSKSFIWKGRQLFFCEKIEGKMAKIFTSFLACNTQLMSLSNKSSLSFREIKKHGGLPLEGHIY